MYRFHEDEWERSSDSEKRQRKVAPSGDVTGGTKTGKKQTKNVDDLRAVCVARVWQTASNNWMDFPSWRFSAGDNQHSYLVLLRELEIVVCLEALNVICQLRDRDGRVACHACRAKTSKRGEKKETISDV